MDCGSISAKCYNKSDYAQRKEIVVNSPARIFSRIFSSTVDTVVDADVANARIRLIDEITTIASQSIIP